MPSKSLLDEPPNDQILDDAQVRLAQSRTAFDRIERCVVARHGAGDWHGAIAHAAAASRFASGTPCGVLASPAIEAVLLDIGRRTVPGRLAASAAHAGPERILHVFTETYPIGGHTRLAQRWIDLDPGRRHSLFVSRPTGDVPAWLTDSVTRTGGSVAAATLGSTQIDRARELRAVAMDADVVVLHAHMYDPVPVLAFADAQGRPPVVLLNHGDHVFWLGAGIADVVASIRGLGSELAVSRRGIDPARCRLLGIPLPAALPAPDRAAERRRVGFDPERPVLVSVASGYKYAPVLQPPIQQLAVEALSAVDDALLIVVGPDLDPAWAQARDQTGGRVHVLGKRTGIYDVLGLADLYLDSWPCSSGTSMLEAGLHGLPIVTMAPDPARQGPLTLHLESLDGVAVACDSAQGYAAEVERLVRDGDERRRLGAATRARIVDHHAGPSWTAALEELLDAARVAGPAPVPAPLADAGPPATWEGLLDALHRVGGIAMAPEAALMAEGAGLETWSMAGAGAGAGAGDDDERRAVAAPRIDRAAVRAVVEQFRELVATGAVAECVVALAPDDLDAGLGLFEAELATGADVDIDVLTLTTLEGVLRSSDLCLAEAGSTAHGTAERVGAQIRLLAAA